MLDNFQEIAIDKPVDLIIKQIRELITSNQLKPGDKLPPERKMAEKLGVSRSHIRSAIAKLEFYGILKTIPQSGTLVAGLGIVALESLISDVLQLEDSSFQDLVETRVVLECQAARTAAVRRKHDDIISIQDALEAFENKIRQGLPAVEEDLMFHLKIAEAAKNSVLKSLMLVITPDIVKNYNDHEICKDAGNDTALEEHAEILKYIICQDPEQAGLAMGRHLKDVVEQSKLMAQRGAENYNLQTL